MGEGIPEPVAHTLKNRASNEEEYDYLQLAVRQLFGEIISVFRGCQSLPGIRGSLNAQHFFGRLSAYAVFLEKRRSRVFSVQGGEAWQQNHKAVHALRAAFKNAAQSRLHAYGSLKEEALNLRTQPGGKPSLMNKLLNKQEKLAQKLEETEKEARQVQYEVHDKRYHLPADWREQIVNLEFDARLIGDTEKRRYALPDGDNGVSKLPLVVRLAENRLRFDLQEFAAQFA